MKKESVWNRVLRSVWDFFTPEDVGQKKTTAQQLQEAVSHEIELASAKKQAAQAAMAASAVLRKQLADLVRKSEVLEKAALQREQAGDSPGAQKMLALQLKIRAQIASKTQGYQEADQRAANLIEAARAQHQAVETAKRDLPQRVLQLQLNRMREEAADMEKEAAARLAGAASFQSLTDSVDLQTSVLDAGILLSDNVVSANDEAQTALDQIEFQEAYRRLQAKATESSDAVEAELVEGGDPEDEAKRLLSGPVFGGKLQI